jgi:hypothetical protein
VKGLRADDTHRVAGIARRSDGVSTGWAKVLCLGALAGGLLIAGFEPGVPSALAASTTMVDLGQASTYAVLSGASVGNTVSAPGAPYTTLRGDLGVNANAQPTGFPPGVVTGTVNGGNAAAAQRTPTWSRPTTRSPLGRMASRSRARWPVRRSRLGYTPSLALCRTPER